jgi:hypothetical protein
MPDVNLREDPRFGDVRKYITSTGSDLGGNYYEGQHISNPRIIVQNMDAEQITAALQRYLAVTSDFDDLGVTYSDNTPDIVDFPEESVKVLRTRLGQAQKANPRLRGDKLIQVAAAIEAGTGQARRKPGEIVLDSELNRVKPQDELKQMLARNNERIDAISERYRNISDRAIGTSFVDTLVNDKGVGLWNIPESLRGDAYRILRDVGGPNPNPFEKNPALGDFVKSGTVRGTDHFQALTYSARNAPLPNYWGDDGSAIAVIDEGLFSKNPNYEITKAHDNLRRTIGADGKDRYLTWDPADPLDSNGRTAGLSTPNIDTGYKGPTWLNTELDPNNIKTRVWNRMSDNEKALAIANARESDGPFGSNNIAGRILSASGIDEKYPNSPGQKTIVEEVNTGVGTTGTRRVSSESSFSKTSPSTISEKLDRIYQDVDNRYTVGNLLGANQPSTDALAAEFENIPKLIEQRSESTAQRVAGLIDKSNRVIKNSVVNDAPLEALLDGEFGKNADLFRSKFAPRTDNSLFAPQTIEVLDKYSGNSLNPQGIMSTPLTEGGMTTKQKIDLRKIGLFASTGAGISDRWSDELLREFDFRSGLTPEAMRSMKSDKELLALMDNILGQDDLGGFTPQISNKRTPGQALVSDAYNAVLETASSTEDVVMGQLDNKKTIFNRLFGSKNISNEQKIAAMRELLRRSRAAQLATTALEKASETADSIDEIVMAQNKIHNLKNNPDPEIRAAVLQELIERYAGIASSSQTKNLKYTSATPNLLRRVLPGANAGIRIIHDPNPNPITRIHVPTNQNQGVHLQGFGTAFDSVEFPSRPSDWKVVYDKTTPFMKRPLSTHLANLTADAQILKSQAPLIGKSLRNDALAFSRFGGAALAKGNVAFTPLQIATQGAAAGGAFDQNNVPRHMTREYGMSDPLGVRPVVDSVMQSLGVSGSEGPSYSQRVNDPQWMEQQPLFGPIYAATTGNLKPLGAFAAAYLPGLDPNDFQWSNQETKKK